RVLVAAARSQSLVLPGVTDFEALPGAGVAARLLVESGDARQVIVGNRRLMCDREIDVPAEVDNVTTRLEAAGQTPLLVALDNRIVGAIGVRDTVRPEAAQVLAELRSLGIEQIVLLSGDRSRAAAEVAQQLGIDRWQAELRPDEKAQWLAGWRAERGTG